MKIFISFHKSNKKPEKYKFLCALFPLLENVLQMLALQILAQRDEVNICILLGRYLGLQMLGPEVPEYHSLVQTNAQTVIILSAQLKKKKMR